MEPTRNLLLIHTRKLQQLSDWLHVKSRIDATAPDIEVRIAENGQANSVTRRWQVKRPSLVFSPNGLTGFTPLGGRIYVGKFTDKLEQNRRLAQAQVPVPRTIELVPGITPSPKAWGDFVIVKPATEQDGVGVRVVRTVELGQRLPALMNINSKRNQPVRRFLLQEFIDHTDDQGHPFDYRALMLFGQPLYLHRRTWAKPRRPVAELADELSREIASNVKDAYRERKPVKEKDILDLAAQACAAFPKVPVCALDIIRDRNTGRPYVLEISTGGLWHLSSDTALKKFPEELRRATYEQFNALDTTADLLIEKTRAEAC